MIVNYINLSNGIEALAGQELHNIRFMRLRSTDCEHKHWAEILDGLPDGFLLDVAAGHRVIVHDRSCSMREGGLSRAQWQGINWVRYALARADWGSPVDVQAPRMPNGPGYWKECWAKLPDRTISRLRWFSRWMTVDAPTIHCVGGLAQHDGDTEYYRKQWKYWWQIQGGSSGSKFSSAKLPPNE